MKKKTLFDCFLAVIPVAAFFLATTGDSVTVYDLPAQEVRSLSYFAPAVGATVSFLTPFAGMRPGIALRRPRLRDQKYRDPLLHPQDERNQR